MEVIGDYEYNKKDLIGHGAFAVVFKGRYVKVRIMDFLFMLNLSETWKLNNWPYSVTSDSSHSSVSVTPLCCQV